MRKIKKGDNVIVITGKDKGKKGIVESVLSNNFKVIISGINILKKHKKSSQKDEGGIQELSFPIHISNVKLLTPGENKPSRIGFTFKKNKKYRFSKFDGNTIN
jgi:large subunit ribosomal protein L24